MNLVGGVLHENKVVSTPSFLKDTAKLHCKKRLLLSLGGIYKSDCVQYWKFISGSAEGRVALYKHDSLEKKGIATLSQQSLKDSAVVLHDPFY